MKTYNHDRLAELLGLLPPAPEGWPDAARELPRALRTLDDLVMRAEADAELRRRMVDDLESALAQSGIAPTPRILEEARARLRPA